MKITQTKIKWHFNKGGNPYWDIIEGHLSDGETVICYSIKIKEPRINHRNPIFNQKKGTELLEVYIGQNYVPGSTRKSFSKTYTPIQIPKKYRTLWEELKEKYKQTKYEIDRAYRNFTNNK